MFKLLTVIKLNFMRSDQSHNSHQATSTSYLLTYILLLLVHGLENIDYNIVETIFHPEIRGTKLLSVQDTTASKRRWISRLKYMEILTL